MLKIGDTVRFLNSIGGGKVTKIQDKLAYVEDEDGFETPVLIRECVVVDTEKPKKTAYDKPVAEAPSKYIEPEATKQEELKIEETETGDKINVVLAYEPDNIKNISSTDFTAYLVNDSNYFLHFTYMSRNDQGEWKVRYTGTVEPNIQILLEEFGHEDLSGISHIAVQAIAFKRDKSFEIKNPIKFERRLDTTKFYKLHAFTDNEYFDSPVIAFSIVKDDIPNIEYKIDANQLQEAMREKKIPVKKQSKKHESHSREIIECDLHIHELLDDTTGLSNKDMLDVQLDKFRETMNANLRRKGAKIHFISGKI